MNLSDEDKNAAIKRDAEAMARLIIDIYLEKKIKEKENDDNVT